MAERVGFEPTELLTARWFSRPVHSTRLCHLSEREMITYNHFEIKSNALRCLFHASTFCKLRLSSSPSELGLPKKTEGFNLALSVG